MQSILGWTLLSQDALRRAETQLRDDVQGVRDEIGFLLIHQGYADYFFPGTSVLQTRLKYALFVPWIYQKVAKYARSGQFYTAVQHEEIQLAGRLKQSGEAGIIGGRSYPDPTSQPASMVYWTALKTWGILRSRFDGSFPSRFETMRMLSRRPSTSRLMDADKQPLEIAESVFAGLPKPPKVWDDVNKPLTFLLDDGRDPGEEEENSFLRQHLIGVARPNTRNEPVLLSILVDARIPVYHTPAPWVSNVLAVVDTAERDKLLRAQQIAALAAIGRGVYAALVEEMVENDDNRPTSGKFRDQLKEAVAQYRSEAVKLDVNALCTDVPTMPNYLEEVLQATQKWLRDGRLEVTALCEPYRNAELKRKGRRRSRLADSLYGRERRQESDPPEAYPLAYRWDRVQMLLQDLGSVSD